MTFERKLLRELARGRFDKISKRSFIIAAGVSYVLVNVCILLLFLLDSSKIFDIPFLDVKPILDPLLFLLSLLVSLLIILAFYGIAYLLFEIMEKKVSVLEFTLFLHRKWYGDSKLYYFEQFPLVPSVGFKDSILRSIFGGFLVISIAIIILENFLVIPALLPYFWTASTIIVTILLITLPFIIIFLITSPNLTQEINLYYHDKENRAVHNVGMWLDNSLKIFAGFDVALVIIIVLTTSTVSPVWLVLMVCLLTFLIALFIIILTVYNRNYHASLREKLKSHLEEKYKIPYRNISLTNQIYYCDSCRSVIDVLNSNQCEICRAKIRKCIICGETFGNIRYALFCPYCGDPVHRDEFISWIKMRKKCPSCNQEIKLSDLKFPDY